MSKSTAKAIVTPAGIMPLDYLLSVMRDPTASPARRDAAARCAVQYTHKRMADTRVPKRERRQAAAETAGEGTSWQTDLEYPDGPLRQ